MENTRKVLVPDYFPDFVCKGGACRAVCCDGWGISVSMEEYFRLLGMDCSPQLRRKIDGAFHLAAHPSPQRYAQVTPNWQGDCPIRREDGLCALQCECGEGVLPTVCRVYPRGLRTAFERECACANSCEGVLELMFAHKEPLSLIEQEEKSDLPMTQQPEGARAARRDRAIRDLCIDLLQDRTIPLAERLCRLADVFASLTPHSKEQKDEAPSDEHFALRVQYQLAALCGKKSRCVHDYAVTAMERLGLHGENPDMEKAAKRYRAAAAHMDEVLPDWPVYFEHMLVNHILFIGFPYSERQESLWDETLALCAVYALVRFLTIGWMADKSALTDFVDVCAAAFRLIDHSSFDWNAAVLLHEIGATSPSEIARIVRM